uniref:Phytanoyl-CoA dioxygenase n=1 Tax=Kwoniella bestiolae CBS 10118 TaxID=1296100 RepID=A0A1B9FWE1_9TREE|nr:phytanoyl-CoA dioxygenase [Kwoniella bestiolae CBS 10118]OCF23071.1 phytanoyl-CoA dioxygenase [Kwoniella bestiolae CBS 10118]
MNVLTPSQLEQWKSDGYLLLPSFFSPEDVKEMLDEAKRLCDEFDIEGHPLTAFKTAADGEHVGDDYFLNSNDKACLHLPQLLTLCIIHGPITTQDIASPSRSKSHINSSQPELTPSHPQIRYFLEPTATSPATPDTPAKLLVPPSQSINKIGHALAVLNPIFHKYTLENEKIRGVARDLDEQRDPRVLQSMIICKQPRIGGTVPCHNDSTFLYTDPPSAIGFWIALEDCQPSNGCLSFLPGSHKTARISSRFIRNPSGKGTTFIDLPDVKKNEEDWEGMEGWRESDCKAGTLVLIHGSVMHKSPPNLSDKTRFIYTFHMIEGAEGTKYDEKNWYVPVSFYLLSTRPKLNVQETEIEGGQGLICDVV